MSKPPALRREVERTRHHQHDAAPVGVAEMVGVGLLLAMLALKIAQVLP